MRGCLAIVVLVIGVLVGTLIFGNWWTDVIKADCRARGGEIVWTGGLSRVCVDAEGRVIR